MAETFTKWDPVNYLHTKEDIQGYLEAAVEEDCGDGRLLRATLNHIARALDEKDIHKQFEISGKELVKAFSDDGNLSFATISYITRALGMKLKATPAKDSPVEEIVYRAIGRDEAQSEILDLLAVEPDLCYDDISDRLLIEMEMVVDICIELENEGVIKADV